MRKRLAAFINSYPEKHLSNAPDDQQSGLKRKREEDPRHKQTLGDNRKAPDDDDAFELGNEGSSVDDDMSKDDPHSFTTKEEKSSRSVKVKRDRTVRSQDRSNRSEKNWTTAMKRH